MQKLVIFVIKFQIKHRLSSCSKFPEPFTNRFPIYFEPTIFLSNKIKSGEPKIANINNPDNPPSGVGSIEFDPLSDVTNIDWTVLNLDHCVVGTEDVSAMFFVCSKYDLTRAIGNEFFPRQMPVSFWLIAPLKLRRASIVSPILSNSSNTCFYRETGPRAQPSRSTTRLFRTRSHPIELSH